MHTHTFSGWMAEPRPPAGGLLVAFQGGGTSEVLTLPTPPGKVSQGLRSAYGIHDDSVCGMNGEVEARRLLSPLRRKKCEMDSLAS